MGKTLGLVLAVKGPAGGFRGRRVTYSYLHLHFKMLMLSALWSLAWKQGAQLEILSGNRLSIIN